MGRGWNRLIPVLLLPAALVSCDAPHDVTRPGSAGEDLTAYITAVGSDGERAIFAPGTAPGLDSGPVIQVGGNEYVINGGSSLVRLSSQETLTRVTVAVEGVPGYWDLELPPAEQADSVSFTMSIAQGIPAARFEAVFAGGNAEGAMGPPVRRILSVVEVGSGDLQISLSWEKQSDVDLHVVEPSGEEIFYGDRVSETAGELDLDSNRACAIDGVGNENVTWPTGEAPHGTYTVRANLWDSCGEDPVPFVVTVVIDGIPLTFTGTLTGPGNNGNLGDGLVVTTFDY